MEKLNVDEIEFLKQRKYPGFSYALLINTIGLVFTILLWIVFFAMDKKAWEVPLISIYKFHIVFPILLWGVFYGVSALLNQKINLDIQRKEKIVEIKKLKEVKYNRRFPFSYEMTSVSGHLAEYLLIFDDNTKFISFSNLESVEIGKKYKISKAKYSGIVVMIESLDV